MENLADEGYSVLQYAMSILYFPGIAIGVEDSFMKDITSKLDFK